VDVDDVVRVAAVEMVPPIVNVAPPDADDPLERSDDAPPEMNVASP
jgi:hypothetical protein